MTDAVRPLTKIELDHVRSLNREIDAVIEKDGNPDPVRDAGCRAIIQAFEMPGAVVRVVLTSLDQLPLLAKFQNLLASDLDAMKTIAGMQARKPGDRKVTFELKNGSAIEVVPGWQSRRG